MLDTFALLACNATTHCWLWWCVWCFLVLKGRNKMSWARWLLSSSFYQLSVACCVPWRDRASSRYGTKQWHTGWLICFTNWIEFCKSVWEIFICKVNWYLHYWDFNCLKKVHLVLVISCINFSREKRHFVHVHAFFVHHKMHVHLIY